MKGRLVMPALNDRNIEHLDPGKLKPAPRNARTHSKKQINQLVKSMKRYGFTSPILIDDENHVLAGHGRLQAALQLGMKAVPCLRLVNMSEGDKRAYLIADNKLALNAGWDFEILADEIQGLIDAEPLRTRGQSEWQFTRRTRTLMKLWQLLERGVSAACGPMEACFLKSVFGPRRNLQL